MVKFAAVAAAAMGASTLATPTDLQELKVRELHILFKALQLVHSVKNPQIS